ncbi:MAG: hypothetical protein E5W82_16940 [Mesorhizobium sp.]|nr:MAG: hypothetical protein E5W91_15440 [Mesorhizobium sp.]TIS89382.1 MAG: hypothetical protein E5W89_16845 [Mesorhizobium sp.]TJW11987.1 MAG: hypothetical protein E5W82_16940 [Mesorhizobium sp.]TJW30849.1 MAG: hypothetical protein E5W83_37620 [Mesorhizobium sp.]
MSRALPGVTLASATIAVLVSGCAMVPGKAVTVSSTSTESGYPDMSGSERKTMAPEKAIKGTLPIRVASHSFLGRAPYICTPSGFGRTSGCFLRRG